MNYDHEPSFPYATLFLLVLALCLLCGCGGGDYDPCADDTLTYEEKYAKECYPQVSPPPINCNSDPRPNACL